MVGLRINTKGSWEVRNTVKNKNNNKSDSSGEMQMDTSVGGEMKTQMFGRNLESAYGRLYYGQYFS